MGKIKKGINKFRKILVKNQDFITPAILNSWKTTLDTDELNEEALRRAFKQIHSNDYTSDQKDFCWECKMESESGEENEENLLHALLSCPKKAGIREAVHSTFMIAPPTYLYGAFATTNLQWLWKIL
jgi:hypothetical protein